MVGEEIGPVPSVRSVWPAGGAAAPGAHAVALVRDDLGNLILLHVDRPGPDGHVSWSALSTACTRMLAMASGGTMAHGDPVQACAIHAVRAIPRRIRDGGGLHPWMRTVGDWSGDAAACMATLIDACGPGSFVALCMATDPEGLAEADALWGRDAVDAAIVRMPLLAPVVDMLGNAGRGPSPLTALTPALAQGAPASSVADALAVALSAEGHGHCDAGNVRAIVRHLGGATLDGKACLRALTLCGLAPRDWMPTSGTAMEDMADVLSAARELARMSEGALDASDLIAPTKGDWTGMACTLSGLSPGGIHMLPRDVQDVVRAFRDEAMDAAFRAAGRPPLPRDDARMLAWGVLFRGKGLPAVARASRDWHARPTRALAGRREWTAPFPAIALDDGIRLVPLSSDAELSTEGRTMRHCVGGYGQGCLDGRYAIVSVRDRDGRSTSTIQVDASGRILQHRGILNGRPSAADLVAAERLSTFLAKEGLGDRNGRFRVSEARDGHPRAIGGAVTGLRGTMLAFLRSRRRGMGREAPDRLQEADGEAASALLAWDRFLPRQARGGVGPFTAHVSAMWHQGGSDAGCRAA